MKVRGPISPALASLDAGLIGERRARKLCDPRVVPAAGLRVAATVMTARVSR
jgi:hypothetical protein